MSMATHKVECEPRDLSKRLNFDGKSNVDSWNSVDIEAARESGSSSAWYIPE